MKISNLIAELSAIKNEYGNIEVQLQSTPSEPSDEIIGYEAFFVVTEKYEEGVYCNLRTWPY